MTSVEKLEIARLNLQTEMDGHVSQLQEVIKARELSLEEVCTGVL